MGSRVREQPERLFEVFVEIAQPATDGEAPFVLQQFPEDYEDKGALAMIPKFAFPCPTDSSKVDHFTFVLTDLDSMFRFGYCRYTTGHQTCLCLLSWLPWYEIFFKVLDLLAEISNRTENNQFTDFLQTMLEHEVPLPKIPVTIVAKEEMFSFTAPDPNALPSIPGSRNLTEYYNAVDPSNMMLIFASMLHERRIYMTSSKLSRLTSCIHAAETLLYPMNWQHLYIPVLPSHLIDYISAPVPYLIGVHSNLIKKLKLNRVDVADAVCVDLDTNTVTTEYDDLNDLPEDVSSFLKKNLKTDVIKSSMMKAGDAISKAFLESLVRLIGGYRDALKFRPGAPITFDEEAFVQSRPSQSTQAFLEGMLTLQIFQQFIEGRLHILNAGEGFTDIFEQRAIQYADKLNSQSRYKEWLKNMKKSGRKGKEVWNGLKDKVLWQIRQKKKMKVQGKKAMADFKTKLSGITDADERRGGFQVSGGVVHSKPDWNRPMSSVETGYTPTRPPRPPQPAGHSKSLHRTSINNRHRSVRKVVSSEDSKDDSDLRLSYHTVDMSLMADLDIQAAMLRSASAELLPNQTSSGSVSSTSSGSLDDVESSNIAFDHLHSSEEGLPWKYDTEDMSSLQGNTDVPVLASPASKNVADTGDKLIMTRPVASLRGKTAQGSPSMTPPSQAHRSINDEPPPRPPPRKSNVKKLNPEYPTTERPTTTVQDSPLIRFETSESETTDTEIVDPLSSKKSEFISSNISSTVQSPSKVDTHEEDDLIVTQPLERNRAGRSSLSRTKAFRKESAKVPVRPGYRDNPEQNNNTDDTTAIFDPLSSLPVSATSGCANDVASSDPVSSQPLHGDNSDLMHDWSLASLAKGPSISLPTGNCQPGLRTHLTHPSRSPLVGDQRKHFAAANSHSVTGAQLPQNNLIKQGTGSGQPGVTPGQQHVSPNNSLPSSLGKPSPGKLSHAMYPPYPSTTSSTASNNMSVLGRPPRGPSHFAQGGFKHVAAPSQIAHSSTVKQPVTSSVLMPSRTSSSSPSPANIKSDPFSDLLDIDFGGPSQINTQKPNDLSCPSEQASGTEMGKVPPPRPPPPRWETFE